MLPSSVQCSFFWFWFRVYGFGLRVVIEHHVRIIGAAPFSIDLSLSASDVYDPLNLEPFNPVETKS